MKKTYEAGSEIYKLTLMEGIEERHLGGFVTIELSCTDKNAPTFCTQITIHGSLNTIDSMSVHKYIRNMDGSSLRIDWWFIREMKMISEVIEDVRNYKKN